MPQLSKEQLFQLGSGEESSIPETPTPEMEEKQNKALEKKPQLNKEQLFQIGSGDDNKPKPEEPKTSKTDKSLPYTIPEAEDDINLEVPVGLADFGATMATGMIGWLGSKAAKNTGTAVYGRAGGEEAERWWSEHLQWQPQTKLGMKMAERVSGVIDTLMTPIDALHTKMKEAESQIPDDHYILKRAAEINTEAVAFILELGMFKGLHASVGKFGDMVRGVKRFNDLALPGETLDVGTVADVARGEISIAKNSGAKMIRTNSEFIEASENTPAGVRDTYSLTDSNGKNAGTAEIHNFGDRLVLKWEETGQSPGNLTPKDLVKLSKMISNMYPWAEKMIGKRIKGDTSRSVSVQLKSPIPKNSKLAKSLRKRAKTGLDMQNLKYDRYGSMQSAILDSELFIYDKGKGLSEAERSAVPFMIEDTPIENMKLWVEEGRLDPEIVDVVRNPSERLDKVVEQVRDYFAKAQDFRELFYDDAGYRENYINRVWKKGDKPRTRVTKTPSTYDPSKLPRYYESIADGMNNGLDPLTTDFTKLIRIYDSYRIQAAFNLRFADGLKALKVDNGMAGMLAASEVPFELKGTEYIKYDHPALKKSVAWSKSGEGEITHIREEPVYIHKDILHSVKALFDPREYQNTFLAHVQNINSYLKKGVLSASLFHHLALTESALAHGLFWKSNIQIVKSVAGDLKSILKEGQRGKPWYLEERNLAMTKDALQHGLSFSPMPDYHVTKIQGHLDRFADWAKDKGMAGKIPQWLAKGNKAWDALLWDHMHTTHKLMAYEKLVQSKLKSLVRQDRPITKAEITLLKREAANFVNDSFGGQNFEINDFSPDWHKFMNLTLLSPDWTISTMKQGLSVVRFDRPTYQKMGAKFWARAMFWYNAFNQSLNYYSSKKLYGKGRFTFGNPKGKKFDALLPWKGPDDEELYLRSFKQLREVPEWLTDKRKVFGKINPALTELYEQWTGTSPGGFPAEWTRKELRGKKQVISRLKSASEAVTPFSLRHFITGSPKPFAAAIPVSRGPSAYAFRRQLRDAIESGNKQEIEKIKYHALRNGFDDDQLEQDAKNMLKREKTGEYKQIAKEIMRKVKQNTSKGINERDTIEMEREKSGLDFKEWKEVRKQYLNLKKIQRSIKRKLSREVNPFSPDGRM